MVVSNGHQLKKANIQDDEDDDEESHEEPPACANTTHTVAIKLGNDILTVFQSREEGLADSMFTILQRVQHEKLKHS